TNNSSVALISDTNEVPSPSGTFQTQHNPCGDSLYYSPTVRTDSKLIQATVTVNAIGTNTEVTEFEAMNFPVIPKKKCLQVKSFVVEETLSTTSFQTSKSYSNYTSASSVSASTSSHWSCEKVVM